VEGTTALIGDACHPMLPYVAQGAAQAMEDGMVLSVILSAIRDRSQVDAALVLYEVREIPSTSLHA
jgi:salicylate hydroxylase